MKKFILSFVLLCLAWGVHAQHKDDILMVVAGKMISKIDFLEKCHFQTGTLEKDAVNSLLTQFVNHRLLVAEAESQRLDTLSEFRHRMAGMLNATASIPNTSNDEWKEVLRGKPSVMIAHLFLPLHQHASLNEQQALRKTMDAVYDKIRLGEDFMQAASSVSPATTKIEWLGLNQTLAEVETVAFKLAEGDLSAPVLCTDGFHLLKCLKVGFDDALETNLPAAESVISKSLQDYREGLMVQMLYDKNANRINGENINELRQYFSLNQKKYSWDIPHFKGVVYQSKDKKSFKQVKKLLAKQPENKWQSIIENPAYSHVFQNVKFSPIKLFVLGEDAHVDELAFGGPKIPKDQMYPYLGLLGKELKYPEELEDVEPVVWADFQNQQEQEWLADLRQRHGVAINDKALKSLYK